MRTLPWGPPLIPLLGLLLCAAVCGANAPTTPGEKLFDFEKFCLEGLFKGVLSTDKMTCTTTFNYDLSLRDATYFCKAQHFSGAITTSSHQRSGPMDSNGKFECVFHRIICPPGFEQIQSQCFNLNPASNYANRAAACKAAGGSVVERSTKVLIELITVHTGRLHKSNVWLNEFSKRADESPSIVHVTTPYMKGSRLQRGMVERVTDADRQHHVVCEAPPYPSFYQLELWCNMLKEELLFGAAYMKSISSCVYKTANHYPAAASTDKAKVTELHQRCSLFSSSDFVPVNEELFKDSSFKALPFLLEGHPVRIPGASKEPNQCHLPEAWHMFTSKQDISNVAIKNWARSSGPRQASFTAEGGAYTLALVKHSGELKYTDVPPYTPLPVVCIATLNSEQSVKPGCNCPYPGVCRTSANKCECPAGMEDKFSDYRHKITHADAPRARICHDCEARHRSGEKHTIVIVLSREEHHLAGNHHRLIKVVYEGFVQGKAYRLIVVVHDIEAMVVYDSKDRGTNEQWSDILARLQKTDGTGTQRAANKQHVWLHELVPIAHDKYQGGDIYSTLDHGVKRGATFDVKLTNFHMPHIGIEEAIRIFKRNDIYNTKKHFVYFNHYTFGPKYKFFAICVNMINHRDECDMTSYNVYRETGVLEASQTLAHWRWTALAKRLYDCESSFQFENGYYGKRTREAWDAIFRITDYRYIVQAPEGGYHMDTEAEDVLRVGFGLRNYSPDVYFYGYNKAKYYNEVVEKMKHNICKPSLKTFSLMDEYELKR